MSTDYNDPAQLKAFLLEQVRRKAELAKLDFKRDFDLSDKRQALSILKDINAMANTFAQEFGDWGFLIFGMSRSDGEVTHEVKAFRELGVDALENGLAQKVRGTMKPAPRFKVHQFEQGGVGLWGAIVIEPGQPGPVVFAKKEQYPGSDGRNVQMWDKGDWFIRTDQATTERPAPEDYVQMMRGQIMAATAPLHNRIDELERQVLRLEGRLEETRQAERAQVKLEVLDWNGELLTRLPYISLVQAEAQAEQEWRDELAQWLEDRLGSGAASVDAELVHLNLFATTLSFLGDDLGPADYQPDLSNLPVSGGSGKHTVNGLRREVELILGPTPDAYWTFDDMQLHNFENRSPVAAIANVSYQADLTGITAVRRPIPPVRRWVGKDAERYYALAQLEKLLEQQGSKRRSTVQALRYIPFRLKVTNVSAMSTGDLRVVHGGGLLVSIMPSASKASEALQVYQGKLLPGETAESEIHYLDVTASQTLVRFQVMGEQLGKMQELEWSFAARSDTDPQITLLGL